MLELGKGPSCNKKGRPNIYLRNINLNYAAVLAVFGPELTQQALGLGYSAMANFQTKVSVGIHLHRHWNHRCKQSSIKKKDRQSLNFGFSLAVSANH